MTDYTKLTEQEINEAVALVKFKECLELEIYKIQQGAVVVVSQGLLICTYNPYNNPKDWAPLLEELWNIGQVHFAKNHLVVFQSETQSFQINEPKLGKAICILWLTVKGE